MLLRTRWLASVLAAISFDPYGELAKLKIRTKDAARAWSG